MNKLIFDQSVAGRRGATLPRLSNAEREGKLPLDADLCAAEPPDLPEVGE